MGKRTIVISCEHAGNYIPKDYRFLFNGREEVLQSHRGWDPGALLIAKYLSRQLGAPFFFQKISRLLLETNRSLHSKELFSMYVQTLGLNVRKYLLEKYYHPYRNMVEEKIAKEIEAGHEVLHLSVHTFTPQLNGVVRTVDVGILYDENQLPESEFSHAFRDKLESRLPDYNIMLNIPYNGADDGFTTYLRTKFSSNNYLGIELEVNQKYVNTPDLRIIKEGMVWSLKQESPFPINILI